MTTLAKAEGRRDVEVGSVIQDNDPRMKGRQLVVVGFEAGPLTAWGQVVKAICDPRYGERGRVKVSVHRIHTDDKPRRSGFRLIANPPTKDSGA